MVTAPPSSPKHMSKASTTTRQRQTSGVIPGKRKRSTREKSVEIESSQKSSGLVEVTFLNYGKLQLLKIGDALPIEARQFYKKMFSCSGGISTVHGC